MDVHILYKHIHMPISLWLGFQIELLSPKAINSYFLWSGLTVCVNTDTNYLIVKKCPRNMADYFYLPVVSSEYCPCLSCNPGPKTVSVALECWCVGGDFFISFFEVYSTGKSAAVVTESVIWVFPKLVIFSPNNTCQMRCEQWAITFRLAYQTITVMTGCQLWLQHASQDSASWYRYLSVCGLTNFTHWRAKLLTDHFSPKKKVQLPAHGRKKDFSRA